MVKINIYSDLLKICISSWDSYKRFCKEAELTRKFLKWLNDDKLGINFIRENIKNIAPYNFQEKAIKKILEETSEGKTLLIEAPTASGKTEVPFIPFLAQLYTKEFQIAPRLIYSLPLRSLSNIMWERASVYLLATLIKTFEDDVNKIEDFLSKKEWLKDYELKLPVGLETGSFVKEGDYLYGGFITVGTIDSIIYAYVAQRRPGGLKNPRLSLPSGLLSTALFVLDEVQMLQDEYYYSPRILNIILGQMAITHVPIILMTATMPTILKNKLLSSIDYDEIVEVHSKRGKIFVDISFLRQGKGLLESLTQKDLIEKIKETNEQKKHTIIIANRVSIALEVYEKISNVFKDKTLLIHGKLNVGDREEAEKRLGREKGLIVIATQVIESGYDFDAGLIITENAPPDSLIQRIGRVARKSGDLGMAFITDVETNEPYPKSVMNATKNLILKENEDLIEDALQNMELTRKFLDEVYKEEYIDEFTKDKDRKFAKSVYYLCKLRLFSLPPENVDFTFRPEMYVTLISMDEEIRDRINEIEKTEEITLSRDEFEKIREKLEASSLNTSVEYAWSLSRKGLLYGRLDIFSSGGNISMRVTQKERSKQIIGSLQLWLLKPEAYEAHIGIREV